MGEEIPGQSKIPIKIRPWLVTDRESHQWTIIQTHREILSSGTSFFRHRKVTDWESSEATVITPYRCLYPISQLFRTENRSFYGVTFREDRNWPRYWDPFSELDSDYTYYPPLYTHWSIHSTHLYYWEEIESTFLLSTGRTNHEPFTINDSKPNSSEFSTNNPNKRIPSTFSGPGWPPW